jgi:hypothetical protein
LWWRLGRGETWAGVEGMLLRAEEAILRMLAMWEIRAVEEIVEGEEEEEEEGEEEEEEEIVMGGRGAIKVSQFSFYLYSSICGVDSRIMTLHPRYYGF